ncbi:hypothetical protein ALMP_82150 [Streptomyces sp. A012304]|nr:hypothetical protein ALMP_82150 [Streptomyces sp. A012304]
MIRRPLAHRTVPSPAGHAVQQFPQARAYLLQADGIAEWRPPQQPYAAMRTGAGGPDEQGEQ